MDLYIQMGHGMQKMSLDLLKEWKNGTVILSPVNISPKSVVNFSSKVHKLGGDILLDPQLYYPRKRHRVLSQYDYWPTQEITLLESGNFDGVISKLAELNGNVGSSMMILPSFIAGKIDNHWDNLQTQIIESASKHASQFATLHTIALSSDVLISEEQVEKIVNFVEQWDVNGLYVVCEHPSHEYLVDNTLWMSNMLALVAGLKRQNKMVVVGYSNHQRLCLSASKCDALASGNFLNVRSLQPKRFETRNSDEPSRRATWYYCPQALTEFKITFLDIAQRLSLLNTLKTSGKMENRYSSMLFGGAIPSSTGYGEGESFKHYLYCLRQQCADVTRSSYEETFNAQTTLLNTAEQILSALHAKGIKGQNRDFGDMIDINQAALAAHNDAYGFSLTQEWTTL